MKRQPGIGLAKRRYAMMRDIAGELVQSHLRKHNGIVHDRKIAWRWYDGDNSRFTNAVTRACERHADILRTEAQRRMDLEAYYRTARGQRELNAIFRSSGIR